VINATPRMHRLFASDAKCFDVAIDHGFFNEASFLGGIERMSEAIEVIVDAAPDAIQLSPGEAPYLQAIGGRSKPSLVLRTDVANVYGSKLPSHLFSQLIDDPVGQGMRLDAACVVVNILLLPDQPELHHQCIRNVVALRPECDRYGMPLMVEPLVMQANQAAGGYMTDGDADKIIPLVRQAVELGADIIKADPTTSIEDYSRVVDVAGIIPVLVRGGGRASDEEIVSRTHALMRQGVSGIVYGRNVIQHANPAAMTRALMRLVHENATPEDVLNELVQAASVGSRA
jgi:class I fructose-bisphosphate aldolase